MEFLETLDYKWYIGIIVAIAAFTIPLIIKKKELKSTADKEQYLLIKKLIQELNTSILYFKYIEIKEEGVFEHNWHGNANIKNHFSDSFKIYRNPDLYFNDNFLDHLSNSLMPTKLAKSFLKLRTWNVNFISEKELTKYVIAGTTEPVPNSVGIANIFASVLVGVTDKEVYFKDGHLNFTVCFEGTFKDYRMQCKNSVKSLKNWLKKHDIEDINTQIFEQKINSLI